MKDEIKICKKCKKTYSYFSTESDLGSDCNEKYPYFLSFIEEGFTGVSDRIFGRVEVYSNNNLQPYDIDEIRFLFKENSDKEKEFYKFREKWDFKDVTKNELAEVKLTIKRKFYEIPTK